MSEGQRPTLLAYLRRLCGPATLDGSDAELLERFAVDRDELAFETLVRRHGPLVYGVCRRVLRDEHAAEDAFQAAFLVLVRQAASVSKKASIRSWLYGVALRVALRARRREDLRRRREQEIPPRPSAEATLEPDVRSILDEEIQRLPEKYRLPIVLCYLESRTNDEAAQILNCPRGTIAVRLARARERLRSRLLRRGVTLAAMTALLSDNALSASVPALLFSQTAKTALTGAAPHSITTLTEGVLHMMYLSKCKMALVSGLIALAMGGAGVGVYFLKAQAPPAPQKEARDKKPLAVAPAKQGKERIEELFEKRKERAEKEWTFRSKLYKEGANEPGSGSPTTLTQVIAASKHLLKAEVELSEKKADRVVARERNVKRLKEIAEVTEAQFKVGRLLGAALAQAQYEQLDAEIEWEREKAR